METRALVACRPSQALTALASRGRRSLQGATPAARAQKRQRVFGAFKPETSQGNRTLSEESSISHRTGLRYAKSLQNFAGFASSDGLVLTTPEKIDQALTDFLTFMFLEECEVHSQQGRCAERVAPPGLELPAVAREVLLSWKNA